MGYPDIYQYEAAFKAASENARLKRCSSHKRILLGNGFSKAYYGDFGYTTLFDAIKDEKGNGRIKAIFDKYGNSNFEGVLRLLQNASWLNPIYDLPSEEILKDYDHIKNALAEAIVKVHPTHTGTIPIVHKQTCHLFISDFDDIFTVNYDLLLYWVLMTHNPPAFGDYFTRGEDTPEEYCEYEGSGSKSKSHTYFLHGALHLFQSNGKTLKRVWGNVAPLVSQVKEAMDQGIYPLVVAEGDSDAKIQQISGNPYLKMAFDKFKNVGGQFFTFGFSFSEQDQHLVNAISWNDTIRYLWVGIRGDFTKPENQRIYQIVQSMKEARTQAIKGRHYKANSLNGDLKIFFYSTDDMNIWGSVKH